MKNRQIKVTASKPKIIGKTKTEMMLIYTRERCLGATTKHEKLPETLWRIPKVKDWANFYSAVSFVI